LHLSSRMTPFYHVYLSLSIPTLPYPYLIRTNSSGILAVLTLPLRGHILFVL
jgi:hypothetical protein